MGCGDHDNNNDKFKMNNTMKNRIKNCFAIFLLLGFIASCDNNDSWTPGPQINNAGVFFYLDESQSVEFDITEDGYLIGNTFLVNLRRDGRNAAAVLQVPITTVYADAGLSIPQSVTFEAGSATAELVITVTLPMMARGDRLIYSLKFDDSFFNPYMASNGTNIFAGEAYVAASVTAENIATYVQSRRLRTVEAFNILGGTSTATSTRYRITLMSERLNNEFLAPYMEQFPTFDFFEIRLPRDRFLMNVVAVFENTRFVFSGPPDHQGTGEPQFPGLVPMVGAGNNSLQDVNFDISRGNWGTTTSGSPPTGHTAAGTGARLFYNFLDPRTGTEANPTSHGPGFTIIICRDDERIFWFRSKDNPNDWFVAVRFQTQGVLEQFPEGFFN